MADPQFRTDLYAGTAEYYDKYRPAYPQDLIDDLARRTGADHPGMLLDLACGTGQLAFALQRHFRQVWAVDQEPDMTAVVTAKASAAGLTDFVIVTSSAETLAAPERSFDLVAIGNAFHRLPRQTVAASVIRWLKPFQYLALVWSAMPWMGQAPWQREMAAALDQWASAAQATDRVPPGWDTVRDQRPDLVVLEEAGFTPESSHEFATARQWTPATLIGLAYSTSFLSRAALGDLADGFEEDLRARLLSCEPAGVFREVTSDRYELARAPA